MDGFSDLSELLASVPTELRDLFDWARCFVCLFIDCAL